MADVIKQYLTGIKSSTGYQGAWLPSLPVHIGAVGPIANGLFVPERSLRKDFAVELRNIRGPALELSYTSESGVTIDIDASATSEMPNIGFAQVSVAFAHEGAFVFRASTAVAHVISNLGEVGQMMVERYLRREWNPDWYFVREVIEVDSALILISRSGTAKVSLAATTPAAPSIGSISAKGGITRQEGEVMTISLKNATPLFKLSRLKRPFFSSGLVVQHVSGGDKSVDYAFEIMADPDVRISPE